MYLVYEKNYLCSGEIDCVYEEEMQLWTSKTDAIADMNMRKAMYELENDFTFMENESNDSCYIFAEGLCPDGVSRDGEFHICLVHLNVQ